MNCPKCGQALTDTARFCTHCGLATSGIQPSSSDAMPTERIPQANTTEADTDPMTGQVLDSKYEIIARIGEGGMGAVYRARRIHIGDEVAVKVLHRELVSEESAVERFRREARAAAMLQHPNIVAIYDYGEARSHEAPAYIVMELVKGRSLRQIVGREGRITPSRAVSLMKAICAGVGAAHRHNVVHRDIKPDNIIVRPPDSEGETETAKVLDFGIAKLRDQAADQHLTQTGVVIGTPYYMSPEQCRAEELDARSDVYSLGAMMYEMLAGTPPFSAATSTGVVAKHLTEPPPPLPPQLNISPAIEAVILRALSKNPAARQPDASVLGRELQSAMSGAQDRTITAQVAPPPSTQPGYGSPPPSTQPGYGSPTPQYATPPPQYATPAPPQYYATPPPRPVRSRAPLIAELVIVIVILVGGLAAVLFWKSKTDNTNDNRNTPGQTPAVASSNSNSNAYPGSIGAGNNRNSSPGIQLPEIPDDSGNTGGGSSAPSTGVPAVIDKIVRGVRLSEDDLAGLSANELRVLRNIVYARHGRSFETPALQRFFDNQPWYRRNSNYNDSLLTAADRANVSLIRAAESRAASSTDTSSLQAEVLDTIEGWAAATRAHDLDAHISYYAPVLDTYYNRKSVSRNLVRADRERAYARYSRLDVQITNIRISVDSSGIRANATFDKTYEFSGGGQLSGSVQQMLWFVRVGGRWRITGEKDLQVYYSR
ncbi:MAG: protein kinase [Blastocatellia bacterium]|nr:protein kinase [Blastocatellia bacterium]